MPDYLRGEKREKLTFVPLGTANSNVFYGWDAKDIANEPNVSSADLAALGHVKQENLGAGALYVLRAQSPKPGRAKKKLRDNPGVNEKGSISTFYGAGAVSSLLGAGWKLVKRPKSVSLSNNDRFITAIAELSNGQLYAFSMNKRDFETYGAALGLKQPSQINTTSEKLRLVEGSSFPRPGEASLLLPNGSHFSSFFSSEKEDDLRSANYKIQKGELIDG